MATSLYKLDYLVGRLKGVATSLYKLVLSCSEVVEGGYKVVAACTDMVATTLFTVSHPRLWHGCELHVTVI